MKKETKKAIKNTHFCYEERVKIEFLWSEEKRLKSPKNGVRHTLMLSTKLLTKKIIWILLFRNYKIKNLIL